MQSVATHELGHTIGLGDIYSSTYGGTLPPSDPRTQDYEQVMNLYDGPQRTLGKGDLAGAQELYGVPNFNDPRLDKIGVFRNGAWYLDYNGNRAWETRATWRCRFGISGRSACGRRLESVTAKMRSAFFEMALGTLTIMATELWDDSGDVTAIWNKR